MWEAIQYVSSGITLAAFIAAVIAWVIKARIESREKLISLAPGDERAKLVENALEFFHVDTAGLTKAQQHELAMEQIRARSKRFSQALVLLALTMVLAAAVTTIVAVGKIIADGSGNSQIVLPPQVTSLVTNIPQDKAQQPQRTPAPAAVSEVIDQGKSWSYPDDTSPVLEITLIRCQVEVQIADLNILGEGLRTGKVRLTPEEPTAVVIGSDGNAYGVTAVAISGGMLGAGPQQVRLRVAPKTLQK